MLQLRRDIIHHRLHDIGHPGQHIDILDAKTGQSLWHFNTGDVITAAPATYSVDGQQFFAIASGTNVFAFGLSDSR